MSVGIDIGTSTTSIIFSDLVVENVSSAMRLPKAQIVEKRIKYRSPVYITPLQSNTELNLAEIERIVDEVYKDAQIKPEEVQTGAVIITGDTARKSNSQAVLDAISKYAGDCVVATAGPALESILAGKGSGAEKYSINNHSSICNFDIGGGTTNMAAFKLGELIDADCIDAGGRLIRFKEGTRVVEYVFPKIKQLAESLGIDLHEGITLSVDNIMKITDRMALSLLEKISQGNGTDTYSRLKTTEKGKVLAKDEIETICFSGGVGSLIYEGNFDDLFKFDDIGVCLAKSIVTLLDHLTINIVRPTETISATVIGAGTHTMEVSGATVTISDVTKLPVQNIPILKTSGILKRDGLEIKSEIEERINWLQGTDANENVAISVLEEGKLGFKDISRLAETLIDGTKRLLEKQDTLIIITKDDYGKVLGQSIQVRLPSGKDVICIDSVDVNNGDYIDIGKPLGIGDAVPIVIKTIAFEY